MQLIDVGNSIIEGDLRRLRKRFRSLEEDLQNYFVLHKNTITEYSQLSCQITSDVNYVVCKERIAIKNPKTSPSSGCRLWFVIEKRSGQYIRCLLYAANEEDKYKKSDCFKIVKDVLTSIVNN